MIKWLILLALCVLIGDPILLYYVYQEWGARALLAMLVVPPLVGGKLVSIIQARARQRVAQSPSELPANLGDEFLFLAARMLFLYPGPLSTFGGLLLLIPGFRRLLQLWALRRLHRAIANGRMAMSASPFGGGVVVSGGSPPFDAGAASSGPLKQAEGTVIDDDAPQLPPAPPDGR